MAVRALATWVHIGTFTVSHPGFCVDVNLVLLCAFNMYIVRVFFLILFSLLTEHICGARRFELCPHNHCVLLGTGWDAFEHYCPLSLVPEKR